MQRFNRNLMVSLLLLTMFSLLHGGAGRAQDDTTLKEAGLLFKDALDLKSQGNMSEAAVEFEKAVRKDRRILAEDDQGLILALKKHYEGLLAKHPEDIKILEGIGFLKAVGLADLEGALVHYRKILTITTDPTVKTKTQHLVDRLKGMSEMTSSAQQEMANELREERLKSWTELEKQDRLSAQAEEAKGHASRMSELYQTKEDLDARIPQLEDEVKALQEEFDKTKRLWYSLEQGDYSESGLYYRRKRRLEDDLSEKKAELQAAKTEFQNATSELARLEQISTVGKANQPGFNGGTSQENPDGNPQTDPNFGVSNPGADSSQVSPDASSPLPDQSNAGSPDGSSDPQNGSGPADPPLPPVENPDFPEMKSNPPTPEPPGLSTVVDQL